MKSSPSEKRTICEIIGSNFIANAQKIDITLYPIFYDIIEMNRLGHSKNTRFELSETQSLQQKRVSKKALDLNGGNDQACLGLLAVRKLSFVLFLLREITTHYSFLTWTAFRSLSLTTALPKSAELAISVSLHWHSAIKKEPIKGSLLMAGTTRLELATSCVTGMRSNQTELRSHIFGYPFNITR